MPAPQKLPRGDWCGFYLEPHRPEKGWMHLFLDASPCGALKLEGTDYVGPWSASGEYLADQGRCRWTKQYIGRHQVVYSGVFDGRRIEGQWNIGPIGGAFMIWPATDTELTEALMGEVQRGSGPIPFG